MEKLTVVMMTLFLAAMGAGCHSTPNSATEPSYEEEVADSVQNNRLLIRMALEENVYNSVATERSIYPKDFRPGTAELNALGRRRVDLLIDASRGARGQIAVLRGDELEQVYNDRVATVRQALADAGMQLADLQAVKADHVGGASVSSDRAVLTYVKFTSEYAPKATPGAAQTTTTTNNPPASKGQ